MSDHDALRAENARLLDLVAALEPKAEALNALESVLLDPVGMRSDYVTVRFDHGGGCFTACATPNPYQRALVGLGIRPRDAILALRDKLLEAKRG